MAKKPTNTTNAAAEPRAAAKPALPPALPPALQPAKAIGEAPGASQPAPMDAPALEPKPSEAGAKSIKSATKARPPSTVAAASKKTGFTQDDVALRAYFLAEKRRSLGLPGDEHTDWIEAERQLKAESKRGGKAQSA